MHLKPVNFLDLHQENERFFLAYLSLPICKPHMNE